MNTAEAFARCPNCTHPAHGPGECKSEVRVGRVCNFDGIRDEKRRCRCGALWQGASMEDKLKQAIVATLADFLAAGWTRQRLVLESHLTRMGVDVEALREAAEEKVRKAVTP